MSRTYRVYDTDSGRIVSVINRVAENVKLSGCSADNGSAVVTAASTTGLLPGMLLVAKSLPAGTTVLTVDSATTFTLSAAAAAEIAGGVMHALAYIPYNAAGEIVTKEVHLEHFRDLFEDAMTFQIRSLGAGSEGTVYARGTSQMKGVLVPKGDIAMAGGDTNADVGDITFVGAFVEDAETAISDHISHTPPREQVQKCSYVHFVLEDGTLLPVLRKPSFDIVPVS